MRLRKYQEEAIKAINDSIEKGDKKIRVAMAVGTGRTAVMVAFTAEQVRCNKKVLILSPNRNMCEQLKILFDESEADVSVCTACGEYMDENVLITTYEDMGGSINSPDRNVFDLMLCDGINFGKSILENLYSTCNIRLCLGFTSSMDKKVKGWFWDSKLVFEYSYADAIQDGYSFQYREYRKIENYCRHLLEKKKFVDNNFLLPKTMLTEVLGSKKPILFCEGNDKSSLDYRVYQAILGEEYTVIPVGGHLEVIQYCDVITKSKWLGIECRGIIDGDNFPENKISSLKDKNVDVLPFNEIEMFLLSDEVLQYMMNVIYPLEANSKIEEFKKNFWISVVKKKENIALTRTKIIVDEYLQKQRIENYSSAENIEKNLLGIAQYNIKAIYSESLERVSEIIDKRDYAKLLIICNLKKEISRGVADKYLDSNYEMKVIQQIIKSNKLKGILKDKYFGQS